jgi:hypothetical protein
LLAARSTFVRLGQTMSSKSVEATILVRANEHQRKAKERNASDVRYPRKTCPRQYTFRLRDHHWMHLSVRIRRIGPDKTRDASWRGIMGFVPKHPKGYNQLCC